jgi:hypothetical protein
MIRITTLLWVALLVVAGGTVMHVSYRVRTIDRHLAELAGKTRQEQDAIRILSAEWDAVNDPQRIDMLSKRYLALTSTPIQRVVTLEDVPLKPSPEQIAKLDAAATKSGRDHPGAHRPDTAPRPAAPAVEVAIRKAAPPPSLPVPALPVASPAIAAPTRDGVGLILARVERRE